MTSSQRTKIMRNMALCYSICGSLTPMAKVRWMKISGRLPVGSIRPSPSNDIESDIDIYVAFAFEKR